MWAQEPELVVGEVTHASVGDPQQPAKEVAAASRQARVERLALEPEPEPEQTQKPEPEPELCPPCGVPGRDRQQCYADALAWERWHTKEPLPHKQFQKVLQQDGHLM